MTVQRCTALQFDFDVKRATVSPTAQSLSCRSLQMAHRMRHLQFHPLRRSILAASATLLIFYAPLTGSAAASLPLPEGVYPYSVVEQDLPTVLREFGQNVGVATVVSPKVQGRLRGRLTQTTAQGFLDNLCESYALDWYFDGYTLFISSAGERETRFLPLRSFSVEDLVNALSKLGFYDDRFSLRPAPAGKSVISSGPPRYVELIEQTLLVLPHPENLRVTSHSEGISQTTIYRGSATSVVKFGIESKAPEARN
jgi:type III secretion protein C